MQLDQFVTGVNKLELAGSAVPRRNVVRMLAHRANLAGPVVVTALARSDVRVLATTTVVGGHWHSFALVVFNHQALAGQVDEVTVLIDLEAFLILAGAEHVYAVTGFADGFD